FHRISCRCACRPRALCQCSALRAAARAQEPVGNPRFNYQSAPTTGHAQHWLEYSAAETERDFDFARRLQLDQARVFIPYSAWAQDTEAFRKNLLHLIRAAHQRGIGVMPTLQYAPGVSMKKNRWPESKAALAETSRAGPGGFPVEPAVPRARRRETEIRSRVLREFQLAGAGRRC